MTRVKICGITNIEDAVQAVKAGADELGINFYAKSSRYVGPDLAREIINELPPSLSKVGVFVNMSIEGVLEIARISAINTIQIHGDEDSLYLRDLRSRSHIRIIRAVRIRESEGSASLAFSNNPESGAHDILLDAWSPKAFGGTGERFDWVVAKKMAELSPTLYLAGGLTPENVKEAITIVRPYAVDVASGVESSPGKKDHAKVAAFIKAAKEAI